MMGRATIAALARISAVGLAVAAWAAVAAGAGDAQVFQGPTGPQRSSEPYVMMMPLADSAAPARFRVTLERGSVDVLVHDEPTVLIEARGDFDIDQAPIDGAIVGNEIKVRSRLASDLTPIHLTVFVPRQAELGIRLLWGGNVTVGGVVGRFDVQTLEGVIRLDDISGPAVVSTEVGSIRAQFTRLSREAPSSFVSGNGDVELLLPPEASALIDATAFFGDIVSELALGPVQQLPGESGSWLRGSMNGDGPTITVVSTFGSVILQSP